MIGRAGIGAILAAALAAVPASAQLTSARVAQGGLAGTAQSGIGTFLGVPFARAPIGALRWKAPEPAAAWQGVRQADRFAASCQQAVTPNGFGPWTREYVVTDVVSEDCLYLNVWTPAKAAGERLPVLVWIHGGAFTSGSGSVPIYAGGELARQGMVVVTVNYRLGHYGFLAHPELAAESPAKASGNYGLMDQIAALQWVRANVAAFGGDPQRVTIAGQSAGAASVHHLIASPRAAGLFAQAIAQSGSGMGLALPDRAAAEAGGARLTAEAGNRSIADLRRMTTAEIDALAAKAPGLRFGPIVDGAVLTDASGAAVNAVPLLTGLTANEMTGLNPRYGQATPDSVRADAQRAYGAFAAELLTHYPVDRDANLAADALARDRGLVALYLWARSPGAGRQPIYAYLWSHPEPGPEAGRYKAFHSSEIPYVFGTLSASPERPFGEIDRTLSRQALAYWANFVRTGNPNGAGLPQWPRFDVSQPSVLEFDRVTAARPALPAGLRSAFERYVAAGGAVSLF